NDDNKKTLFEKIKDNLQEKEYLEIIDNIFSKYKKHDLDEKEEVHSKKPKIDNENLSDREEEDLSKNNEKKNKSEDNQRKMKELRKNAEIHMSKTRPFF
ncbi:19978_t:CDS:1, partial [Dentiscutata erythropus]